ncbi:MAG: 23S rRNA (pseudouridine(1915)-N(3))-methyltransferase RlmH [Desulfobulbales bacterium]|nr:23S rRNA (pseudouridine(1915)-N(3))-methyltransferase RlmH [Desulfobulbales bacterium]
MRIDFLFLGKTKKDYLAAGIADFRERLKHHAEIKVRILKDVKPAGKPDSKIKREEGALLLGRLEPKTFLIVLDPGGRDYSSEKLAACLGEWRDRGVNHITVVLGGALGLEDEVLARADLILSLSKMTFTHEMARLLIVEQFYRAFNILAGTGYHK